MVAVIKSEKEAMSLEHEENGHDSSKEDSFDNSVDNVDYGMNSIRSWVTSPYVFGAALLASMGGFSYGYGTLFTYTSVSHSNLTDFEPNRSGRHLSYSCHATIPRSVPRVPPGLGQLRIQRWLHDGNACSWRLPRLPVLSLHR